MTTMSSVLHSLEESEYSDDFKYYDYDEFPDRYDIVVERPTVHFEDNGDVID